MLVNVKCNTHTHRNKPNSRHAIERFVGQNSVSALLLLRVTTRLGAWAAAEMKVYFQPVPPSENMLC